MSDLLGSIRVASMRGEQRENGPEPGEVPIRIDRVNRTLGNPHVLRNQHDTKERDRVIAMYVRDAKEDLARGGPIHDMLEAHARRVAAGERLVYLCWCKPRACHGDFLAEQVRMRAQRLLPKAPKAPDA